MAAGKTFVTMTALPQNLDFPEVYINEPAVEKELRQIRYLASTIKEDNKIAWLLKAINLIDLTTLRGDDIPATVQYLCQQAAKPIQLPFASDLPLYTAAVCVYPSRVEDAVKTLTALSMYGDIKVASVAAGFPSGQYPLQTRLNEIAVAVSNGANEIDVVINRPLAMQHKWQELYDELVQMRIACSSCAMKTILATGELFSLKDVYYTSMVAMHAGTDFIKTSTGSEPVNATLPVGLVMCRAIQDYYLQTDRKVGFKAAGGIKTAKDALEWMVLVKEQLGKSWLNKELFRIGASDLLNDVVRTIMKELTMNCSN